jgi:hypothetical protein
MRLIRTIAATSFLAFSAGASAGLTHTLTAAPTQVGPPTETFESSLCTATATGPSNIGCPFSDPLLPGVPKSSVLNPVPHFTGVVFPGGGSVPGLTIQSNTSADGMTVVHNLPGDDGLITYEGGIDVSTNTAVLFPFLEPGTAPPSHQVSNNFIGDSLDLIFAPGVVGVSFNPLYFADVPVAGLAGAPLVGDVAEAIVAPGDLTFQVFDSGGTIIDTFTEMGLCYTTTGLAFGEGCAAALPFLNLVATGGMDIGRINILATAPLGGGRGLAGVDNISVVAAVSEPGTIALLGLGILGLGAGVRRRQAQLPSA